MFDLVSRRLLLVLILFAGVAGWIAGTSQTLAQSKPAATGTLFPDPALEAAVRQEVFAKRENQEPLSREEVATISRLEAPDRGIRSLEGLQHCRGLMLIDLADNEISELDPLSELGRLQSVTLAGNQIDDISPLQGLTAIQLLDLSRNKVDQLDVIGKMQNLRTLYLADNQVESIASLANLSKIGSLDIAGNRVRDLDPISQWKWLTTLEISDNRVRSLQPLVGLPNLSMLIMPGNPIETLGPLVSRCVGPRESEQRSASSHTAAHLKPLKIYLNLQSDTAKRSPDSLETLKKAGVSIHDYRRANATRPTP